MQTTANHQLQQSSVLTTAGVPLSRYQLPFPLAGNTEISAALVQPLPLISFKAVKRKNRALTGAKSTFWSDGLFRMFANVPEATLVVQLAPSPLVSKR